jgi:CubicO group peptidase (beta-lactamase class C family)
MIALVALIAAQGPSMAATIDEVAPTRATGADLSDLDAYIARSMADFGVAGLSIAIVKDDRVVMARGYGVRDVNSRQPVDENTIFAIGSMTKPVTAVAAGRLVDAGRLGWNDLLVRRVPGFAVGDAYITGAATVRDALSHRTGYEWMMDPLWVSAPTKSRSELIGEMIRFRPDFGFRTRYGYSNMMFLVAGEAVGSAGGTSWDEVVKEQVFDPLGMTSSTTRSANLARLTNVATPHTNLGAGPRPVPRADIDRMGGAGAINSNAADMARFLLMLASKGTVDRSAFLKPETMAEIFTPQSVMGRPDEDMRRFSNFHLYGLGFELYDYKGSLVAGHGGAIDGMLSEMAVVPDKHLGVVVLTNTDGVRGLGNAIVRHVFDLYLGGERPDWVPSQLKTGQAMRAFLTTSPPPPAHAGAALSLETYVGEYDGPHGTIVVTHRGDDLQLTFGAWHTELDHWAGNTFLGTLGAYGRRKVSFSIGAVGEANRLTIDLIGDFERRPPGASGNRPPPASRP